MSRELNEDGTDGADAGACGADIADGVVDSKSGADERGRLLFGRFADGPGSECGASSHEGSTCAARWASGERSIDDVDADGRRGGGGGMRMDGARAATGVVSGGAGSWLLTRKVVALGCL